MTNRKNWMGIFVTALCVFGLTVSGCVSSKASVIYDEAVPLEQTSWINVNRVGNVTEYNAITVNWPREKVIQIPAGNTLFRFDLYATIFFHNGRKTTLGDRLSGTALFQYNFQPEKIYYLLVCRSDNGQYGLLVYAWNFGETVRLFIDVPAGEKNYVEFVPFLGQRDPSVPEPPRVLN